jgi:signal transduction histidine kinase
VSIHLDQKDGEAILSVSDDGPGIPSQEFERVFRRFYRLERSRSMPGNGLGLSLVAAVVRLHGGSIRLIDNSPGLSVELHFLCIDCTGETTYSRSTANAV